MAHSPAGDAGGKTSGVPFASITWSRFNGSAALPRSTLSLRAETGSATGWLPCNESTLNRKSLRVKPGFGLAGFTCASHIVPKRGHSRPPPAKPHRGSNAFVTSHRITGIRAICDIPGVPTYHPAPSRPCSGLQARLRGIPDLLPIPRFSPHNSVHPCSAVNPSSSRLPLCPVT